MSYLIVTLVAVFAVIVLMKIFPSFDAFMKHAMTILSGAAAAIVAWLMANWPA